METITCQRCHTINIATNSFCKSCDHPLSKSLAKKKGRFLSFLVVTLMVLIIFSIGALIYVDVQHPTYGLRSRLHIVWDVLFEKEWLEKYSNLKKFENNLNNEKETINIEKGKLKNELQILDEKKEKWKKVTDKLDTLQKKLDILDKLKK